MLVVSQFMNADLHSSFSFTSISRVNVVFRAALDLLVLLVLLGPMVLLVPLADLETVVKLYVNFIKRQTKPPLKKNILL